MTNMLYMTQTIAKENIRCVRGTGCKSRANEQPAESQVSLMSVLRCICPDLICAHLRARRDPRTAHERRIAHQRD